MVANIDSVITVCGFPRGTVVKNPAASAGDPRNAGSIPGLGRSLGIENGNPLQYSCLESFMDRGAWQAIVCGIAKSQTQLGYRACMSYLDSLVKLMDVFLKLIF